MFTNRGTCTVAPVSSFAGFVTFETVSPFTPGSVSVTASSTDAGSWTPEYEAAWSAAFQIVAATMIEGAEAATLEAAA